MSRSLVGNTFADAAIKNFCFAAVLGSCLITFFIFVLMVALALPLLQSGQLLTLFTGVWDPANGSYGIRPMMVTSLTLTSLSLLIGIPLSLGTAILATFIAPALVRNFLSKIIRLMAGIPTVLYGFIAVFLLVPLMREHITAGSGMNILTAALVLALLISPTMIIFFIGSLKRIPANLRINAAALGATPQQQLLYIVIPQAWSGIFAGILLGLGRAMGDTLISLMVAGNAVAAPESITDSARTLTAHIALVIASDFESMEFKSIFACGILLYLTTAVLVITFRISNIRFSKKTR